MTQIPDLNGQFFCYVRPNPHGLLGELRDMVRWDMTVSEAIAFHVKNWNFEPNMHPNKLHEASHQPFGIGTVYIPELARYRVQADPNSYLIKPQGYNGFIEGELIAIAIQIVMLRIVEQEAEPNFGWLQPLREGVSIANLHYGSILKKNDAYFWRKANDSETRKSLFEAKFEEQFILWPPGIENMKSYLETANRHGEVLKPYGQPSAQELEAIAVGMDTFFTFVYDNVKKLDIKSPSKLAAFLYDMKVRDLHVLIGGEEAANAYFKSCGVQLETPHQVAKLAA